MSLIPSSTMLERALRLKLCERRQTEPSDDVIRIAAA